MTIRETLQKISRELTPHVGKDEADAMARVIIEDVKGYTPLMLVLNADHTLLDSTVERIKKIVARVKDGEPLQYALGKTYFHGRMYRVNPSVLIPRPETSQLIDIITDRAGRQTDLSVLDIGTGSGCIAVSLALDLPFAKVDAIDISAEAIRTAADNAVSLKAGVNFLVADMMELATGQLYNKTYDIIVSNPPYVLESEKAAMEDRVLMHEPARALFVPDSNPLLFYKPIAAYAATHLPQGGRLYLEINPLCADAIAELLAAHDFRDIEILRDYKGANRFATAQKA